MCNRIKRRLLYGCALLAVLLLQSAYAAAPAGQWWDPNYGYRRKISIPVVGAANLTAGYSLRITFDHLAEVTAGRALPSGNDVRLAYWNGTTWTELDRVVDPESAWGSASSQLWFDTSAIINGNTTNDNYYLYFGNAAAGAPPANADNVFLLYDDFNNASIDGTKWGTNGTVTESGGVITVSSGARLRAANGQGVDTIWETRASMSAATGTGFNYWTTGTATTVTGSFVAFQTNAAGNHVANVSGGTAQAIAVGTPTGYQNYSFAREGSAGVARFWVNGAINATPLYSFAAGAPTGTLRALMLNSTAAGTMSYDYVRVRSYRNAEPISTLSSTLEDNLIAAWYMGEASWNGTAGEVNDSSSNGLDGRSFNGATTAGGVTGCRYGTFNGTNQYVEVADNAAFDLTTQLTVSVWIYPRAYGTELKSIVSKDDNYEFHLNASGQVYWWWNGGGTREITSTGTPVPLNTWTHIAITYQSGVQRLYINGVVRGTNNRAEALPVNGLALQIGYDGAGSAQAGRYWNGFIDAVQIYGKALTGAQVTAAMNATLPCAMAASYLKVTHDNYGIHCLAEPITISPRDSANNEFTSYAELITLNTGTGNGDWSLQTGNGTVANLNNGTANDGIATYQWVSGERNLIFLLTYRQGASSINITASSATITDDNTEGNLVWGASGFTVTSAPLSNPPTLPITSFAAAQTAATTFPVYIAAYGTTPTDSQCGVIETYTGNKSLKFWSTYVNAATGTRQVTITGTTGVPIATTEGASTAQTVAFTNGQASVTALYRDAGAINIAMKDDTVNPPVGGMRGATNDFVVRPASFVLSNILRTSDGFINPAAGAATGTVFIAAGAPFTATAVAVDSGGNVTPNFGNESPRESVRLQSNLVLPSAGTNPAVASNFGTFTNGVATATAFSWGEVGIITLTPRILDGDYLGAGDVIGATSGNVGRFIPFNFGVTASVPTFAPACAASGYVYLGQPLTYAIAPVLTLTARAVGGGTTQNYQGAFFKLVNGTPTTRTYSTSSGTLIQPAASATDPLAAALSNGQATLTFNTASGVSFDRSTLVAPFTPTLALNATVLDTDGVAASTNVNAASTNPFIVSGIVSPQQRYGRIAFRNAVGSELLNLPVPMRAEYFVGTAEGFASNIADNCTTGVSLSLTNFGGNLASGETCVVDSGSPGASGVGCAVPGVVGQRFTMPPLGGDFIAILRAPGVGNDGTVTISTSVPAWLRFNWNATTPGDENPSGIATFGLFKGEAKRIYQTEK